jgi:SpoVK/Ycf46/Vps4 family AAA+-type ATPase
MAREFIVAGMPAAASAGAAAVCRSRLITAATDLREACDEDFSLVVGSKSAVAQLFRREAPTPDPAAARYSPTKPLYTFDHLVLPSTTQEELVAASDLLAVESLVFDTWGLRAIEPFPRTALNFHGPPGTGKTLAAHALASRLGRMILVASYAEIESKYHGDGPKNVKALFASAEAERAMLFIDEADSLLSKRLTNVTQGSEQAINSMRSQLLICLEQFAGIVVFSTNLVANYDKAFETRVRHVRFELPDEASREKIWRRHLVAALPLSGEVDLAVLAHDHDGLCGRDIKNAVIDAAVRSAVSGKMSISYADLVAAVQRLKDARIGAVQLPPAEFSGVARAVRAHLNRRAIRGADTER